MESLLAVEIFVNVPKTQEPAWPTAGPRIAWSGGRGPGIGAALCGAIRLDPLGSGGSLDMEICRWKDVGGTTSAEEEL